MEAQEMPKMPNIPASSQETFRWFGQCLSTAVKQPRCHFLLSLPHLCLFS